MLVRILVGIEEQARHGVGKWVWIAWLSEIIYPLLVLFLRKMVSLVLSYTCFNYT